MKPYDAWPETRIEEVIKVTLSELREKSRLPIDSFIPFEMNPYTDDIVVLRACDRPMKVLVPAWMEHLFKMTLWKVLKDETKRRDPLSS